MNEVLFSTTWGPFHEQFFNTSPIDVMNQRFSRGCDIFSLNGHLHMNWAHLIAQNIDRLHPRAGSRPEEMIELHGHLEGMRCLEGCSGVWSIPAEFDGWVTDDAIDDNDLKLLTCPLCGSPARPHVLWFDEFYDEENYGFASAQRAVANASLCITAGTSGGIPVAERLAGIAARAGATLIDINTRDNPLRRLAARQGGFIEGSATSALQAVAEVVREETAGAAGDPPAAGWSG